MAVSHKEKLASLVASSNLSFSQKELWNLFMKISRPNEDRAVFEASIDKEENLTFLTKQLQNKIWEFHKGKDKWKDLLDKQGKLAKLMK